ncbi:putative damage-inducible protein DinB [Palleronia aestuarii]|uniref:Putative damage-inducible protein DinB n=1 Tax=Palleronia aestuarii TaxID=568105 RepID=A0A2W7N0G9_9RHOB|nr:DinB family protein [Palleronia aestuarii]PZX13618.1 putative damage-inducible protein DinB [Palleronia aestuarii]
MTDRPYAVTMARYNAWQNASLLAAAKTLPEGDLDRDRGAFFGTIRRTFSHLLWADAVWLARFTGAEVPPGGIADSTGLAADWSDFRRQRTALDADILHWATALPAAGPEGDLAWFSGATGRTVTRPRRLLLLHLFNHQTHHRGQIHAMLTAAGAHPDATDIWLMPDGSATGSGDGTG